MYKAVIFDLYGTLLWIPEPYRVYKSVISHITGEYDQDKFRLDNMTKNLPLFEIINQNNIQVDPSYTEEMFQRELEAHYQQIKPYSDTLEVLEKLQSSWSLPGQYDSSVYLFQISSYMDSSWLYYSSATIKVALYLTGIQAGVWRLNPYSQGVNLGVYGLSRDRRRRLKSVYTQ